MTLPSFAVVPVPKRTALADLPSAAAASASTVDANFAKANTYLSTFKRGGAASSTNPASFSFDVVTRYNRFYGSTWADLVVTIPSTPIIGALSWVSLTYLSTDLFGVGIGMAGAGIVGGATNGALALGGGTFYRATSAVMFHPISTLVPGQAVTLAPFSYTMIDQNVTISQGATMGLAFI